MPAGTALGGGPKAPPPGEGDPLRSVHTSNLPLLLDQLRSSLVVSTYQAGKVIVVRNERGKLNTHFRTFAKPMGIAANAQRMTIGGTNTVWEYHNMPAVAHKLEPQGQHDGCYVPRRIHVTGDIDIHELAWDRDDALWVVNTRFCCLCTLDARHSFYPRWRPPFVTALAPEDRCHLNGLAMVDGRPRYVTALGTTDTAGGWRADKARGGILMDVDTNEILLRGLSMPHSPRWYQGKLWLLESGEGSLAVVDLDRRTWQTVAQLPGFTRGLDFVGPLAFIGLSQVRESAVFSGIPLVERVRERTCGVWVVHIETGQTIAFLRFEAGVQEVFAVQVLPGLRFPEILEWSDERLAHSYVLPDEALAEVALPTEEDLRRTPAFHFRRGNDLYGQGKLEDAIAAYEQCVALQPAYPNARYNLGVALADADRHAEALPHLEAVVRAEPERADAHNSLGFIASRLRQPQQAIRCWEHAIGLRPDYAEAHVNLAMTLLQMGDYRRGFAEYEWRRPAGQGVPFHGSHPRWDGEAMFGRTLLIHTEHGSEDAIQFARYLPLAAERCGTLIVVCPTELMPLLATVPGIAQLREAQTITVGEFEAHASLLSLPHVFGTTLETTPRHVPYVDGAALVRRNRNPALALPRTRAPRVGIAWAASPTQRDHADRSCALRDLLPVLRRPGIAFYSLQQGDRHRDLADVRSEIAVRDLSPELRDLADLAVVIQQLDLVISVDAPVAHLAGALGRPVWTLLGHRPDWRWMLDGEVTPWYPTMRLWRQDRPGDWGSVMDRVEQTLNAGHWEETR